MKRVICLVTALLLLVVAGCNEENYPKVTRINVSEYCGVVPMNIEVFGAASGGNESGGATGGVNNLEYIWDFGDGSGATSISYHTYTEAGDFDITLTVKDPDGKSDASSVMVSVIADSLEVSAETVPVSGSIPAGTPVTFNYLAMSCDIDPANDDDYVQLSQTWTVIDAAVTNGQAIYEGRNPVHSFAAAGTYDVHLHVFYAAWEVHRHIDLQVVVGP